MRGAKWMNQRCFFLFVSKGKVLRFINEGNRERGDPPPRKHEVSLNLKLLSTLFVSSAKKNNYGATHHQKRSFWSPSLFAVGKQG